MAMRVLKLCILSSIADSCPVELAAKLSETHRNPAVAPDAPSCRVVVKKVSKTPVASDLRIVACSCVPRIRCRPPPSSSTSPCPKRVDAVVHAHQPGVDSRDRMREPKGSGHTTPLRTHAQTAGKTNGDVLFVVSQREHASRALAVAVRHSSTAVALPSGPTIDLGTKFQIQYELAVANSKCSTNSHTTEPK